MDVKTYLQKQKQLVEQQCRRVKDFAVFDFNYIPETPVVRDEIKNLVNEMLRFEASRIPTHHAIVGSRGSGKTLMIRFLQRLMTQESDLNMLYANCRNHNTSFRIFEHFVEGRTAGFGMIELYERFLLTYTRPTVVVLDEVDLMSPKDKRREILYLLSRSEQPYMVIMLSNSPQVLKRLDAATRSSLQPMPVHFRNYNAEELHAILRDRATRGLRDWEDGRLAEIAAMTTRLANADARVAIKTLHYTALQPSESVATCFDAARRDLVVDVVSDLPDGLMMILWAASTSRSGMSKEIYNRYCLLSRQHREKPFSYVHFCSHLCYLQSIGLTVLAATKVDRTYTNRVLLSFDQSIINSLAKLRFEDK